MVFLNYAAVFSLFTVSFAKVSVQASPDPDSQQRETAITSIEYDCLQQFSVDKDFKDNCMGTIRRSDCDELTNKKLQEILAVFFHASDRVETSINYVANLNAVDIAEKVADIFTGHPGEGHPEAIQDYFTGTYNAMLKSVPEKAVDAQVFGAQPRHPKYLFQISRYLMDLCNK